MAQLSFLLRQQETHYQNLTLISCVSFTSLVEVNATGKNDNTLPHEWLDPFYGIIAQQRLCLQLFSIDHLNVKLVVSMVHCVYDISEYALKVSKIKHFAVITVNISSPSPGLFHYILQSHRLKTISKSLPLFVSGNKYQIPKNLIIFMTFV